jgi:hypothetical protein
MQRTLSLATVFCFGAMSLLVALLVVSFQAQAQNEAYFGLGSGVFKVFEEEEENPLNAYGFLTYRPALEIHGYNIWSTLASTDREFYLSGGISQDLYLTNEIILTPKFGFGLYLHNDGYDLGSPLEFCPTIQMSYELANKARIGLQFVHVSNAEIGDENPGANAIALLYSIPLSRK